ncbi:alpha/beta hydrolase [Actinomadura opuntiae]|uniref:alpha/beta hydrolase n=1 Tax=Actinomadura sp. OS1-43 TaxID=604315 RepID=UPI00255A7E71|nr:alpha/beta fold hydrolase [Actinomadura sp. OS1-43]MDL4814123.1 alpha/beta fold hydrolase [Actinomadura sp. OS1-43]
MEREKVRFVSGGTECVAWHYPGSNGTCVIMVGGFSVTKEPATDLFAKRFNDAGFGVLAFDYRRIGESGGEPRLVLPVKDQLADWQAAIAFAATLPGVDPAKIALWAFSMSGGHAIRVAAENPQVAAVIAQTPYTGDLTATRSAASFQKPLAMVRFSAIGIIDAIAGLFGRPPRLVPLAGEPGTLSFLTTPDGLDGSRALAPGNKYPEWQQTVAARSALGVVVFYRPGRAASRVQCPLLVVVCDEDTTTLPSAVIQVAEQAPQGEAVHLPGSHYAPFLAAHEQAVDAELSFLQRHLLAEPAPAQGGRA